MTVGAYTAAAQDAAVSALPQQPYGFISGSAIDSLRGGLLVGAVVAVDGAPRIAVTDSVGTFMIDSVPAGEYRLVLMDALLDTLALSVVSPSITVTAGDTSYMVMSLPSAETVVRAKCGAGPFLGGPSALVGMVIDAETDLPIAGADVVLAWSEVQASREVGVRRTPRQRTATTTENGTFRICGVPNDISAELMARRGTDTTAAVPFGFSHPLLAIRTISLALAPADARVAADTGSAAGIAPAAPSAADTSAAPRRGRAVVRGLVTTLGGKPIEGARVSVLGAEGMVLTDQRGEFVLPGQPAGSQIVSVRRLGYEPAEFGVNLSPIRETDVAVELPEYVPILSPVVVRADMDVALDRVGFTHRKRIGMGRYMMLEDIERRNAQRVVDLLADFPMLQSLSMGGTTRVITGRTRGFGTNCVTFFVDGQQWMGSDSPADYMWPHEIGAIEAYSAAATPAEFARSGSNCETVAIWTKHKLNVR